MKLSIYIEEAPYELSSRFYLVAEMPDGTRQLAEPVEFKFKPINHAVKSEPTFRFSGEQSMQFFPALHEAMVRSGFLKPKKDESIEAIKYHLEDMRKLVFK